MSIARVDFCTEMFKHNLTDIETGGFLRTSYEIHTNKYLMATDHVME